jgi:hypothetical protein
MKTRVNKQTNNNIVKFIQSLAEKNYAKANESLQKTIENKLFNKIKQYKTINIFK